MSYAEVEGTMQAKCSHSKRSKFRPPAFCSIRLLFCKSSIGVCPSMVDRRCKPIDAPKDAWDWSGGTWWHMVALINQPWICGSASETIQINKAGTACSSPKRFCKVSNPPTVTRKNCGSHIYIYNIYIYIIPTYIPTYLPIYLSTYLPIYLSIYLSVCLSIHLSIYLSIFPSYLILSYRILSYLIVSYLSVSLSFSLSPSLSLSFICLSV